MTFAAFAKEIREQNITVVLFSVMIKRNIVPLSEIKADGWIRQAPVKPFDQYN